MYMLIERFMNKLSLEQVDEFARKHSITLSEDELSFTHEFLKKNWQFILQNRGQVDMDRCKEKFSEENFVKIQKLILEFSAKYSHFL